MYENKIFQRNMFLELETLLHILHLYKGEVEKAAYLEVMLFNKSEDTKEGKQQGDINYYTL